MLEDDVWNFVLEKLDMKKEEARIYERTRQLIQMFFRDHENDPDFDYNRTQQAFFSEVDEEGLHMYICVDCMKDALGHYPNYDEINKSPFNADYIRRMMINAQ